ncbi:acyltransferase domain-containing protein [Paraburkholderia antibiotica]|uniref:[acyl-carrier-protein] S-malonyltransferase n=1 Tax=Paraburkholderia antibiotica TaxID=2728839 RepID=A0A7Y0FFK0_9BURK|nr:acyltransferase domain-containing protein [Paraburkholderia antibiotica]NML34175.1 acyltransferase domain-containing protein [Paraburkholderia antibiotica]
MNRIAFMFPGQGAFYPDALLASRSTYHCIDPILKTIETVAQRRLGHSFFDVIWGGEDAAEDNFRNKSDILQLVIYAVSVANFEILRQEGIEPDVLVGHSFGEIAALVCAGVYSVEQGAQIVCDRIESLAAAAPRSGCMAAVSAGPQAVHAALEAFYAGRGEHADARIQIAVENHRSQTVVSGPEGEMAAFVAHCAGQGMTARQLKAPYAFHHSSLVKAGEVFSRRLKSYPTKAPQYAIYSPILNRYYDSSDEFGNCLGQHLTLPVKFFDGIGFLKSDNFDVYVECGALDALGKIVIRIAGPGVVKTFSGAIRAGAELENIRKVVLYFREMNIVNANAQTNLNQPDFDTFWRASGAAITAGIKAEFEKFYQLNGSQNVAAAPAVRMTASVPAQSVAAAVPPPLAAVPVAAPSAPAVPPPAARRAAISRDQLFHELVAIYAEAMEYPPEVFTEAVELEAELGIDSVKQTEIIQRISKLYGLPPLPAGFRFGDFKAMGQIVDFVHTQMGASAVAGN